MKERTVFIVDDDLGLVRLLARGLRREGFVTAEASSGREALAWLAGHRPELMLLDLKLADMQARELVQQLDASGTCPPFIIITGQGDERVAVEMMKRGARDYLVKDIDFLQFMPEVVKRVFNQVDQEQRLAEAERQIRVVQSAIEQGFSAVLIATAEGPEPTVAYINPSFARVTGYLPEQVVGRPLSSLAGLTAVQQRLRAGFPQGARFVEGVSTFQTGEEERWGEWRIGPVQDQAGRTTHWLIIFRDITERKQLEKEILEISDQERRRIGQDLHDGLCQHLAGIELMSQVLEQKLAARSKSDAARAGEIAGHVREAISQTRALARGLTPVTLESEGLESALYELAAGTERMFGVVCRVECAEPVPAVAPAVATHLYRIAQEAVSNALKHGKATEISIRLEAQPERRVLSITDNGGGLPPAPARGHGMGMHIMEYRAGMIGGALQVQNNPKNGASVVCSIPLAVPL
ncbi:MAG TPA: response regulator [Verrucomicrobiae bacterium]|nr:response regulator [Verrucomicrobiae bacterium]